MNLHGICRWLGAWASASALAVGEVGAAAAGPTGEGSRLDMLATAAAERPDAPEVLLALAAAAIDAGDESAALTALTSVADLGFSPLLERDPVLMRLKGAERFKEVWRRLAENRVPRGRGEIAWTLRDHAGLPAGLAWSDRAGGMLIADVGARAVWRRSAAGQLTTLLGGDGILGCFGLAVDESGGVLWVTTAAAPVMRGYTREAEGRAALLKVELPGGRELGSYEFTISPGAQPEALLSAPAPGPGGRVAWAEPAGPRIWIFEDGRVTPLNVRRGIVPPAPQAVAWETGDALLVADRVLGLVRLDLRSGEGMRPALPPRSSLVDLTSIVAVAEGEFVATQAGMWPSRVVRIRLAPGDDSIAAVEVLESGHPAMGAPAGACVTPDGAILFLANPGWSNLESGGRSRPVAIMRTRIPAAPARPVR